MMGQNIELVISDFDGTLVDTFEANYKAYQKAFADYAIQLTESEYRECFGFRYDDFMKRKGVTDNVLQDGIRKKKAEYYPQFFSFLRINKTLVAFLRSTKLAGIKTILASTATKQNLMNVVNYLGIQDIFDVILTGADSIKGKPSPDIYEKALEVAKISAENALVFEDSDVGCEAAERAGINYIKIKEEWYEN